ncbi:phosphatidylglycerophosphatase A family protein [Thiocystis violacea]|uniref:phosphatidylglycerophosphatase A family protein n=1 Tax=Thiocystis violacea TaxID=13725 RepID=UPI001907C839|nr:phosphatidylglycerophosphatase A [Thiocystis violacea]MBK1721647.1 phosphatidylglycerophosphatase A [Thiocystis violacea]
MSESIKPDWRLISSNPAHFLAFGLGTGLSPKAPGTVGTLVGFPLYFALAAVLPLPGVLGALLLAFVVGVKLCDLAGQAVGEVDHGGIVWDEIVAMALVLCFTPAGLGWWIAAFAAFRFFDILKPWPIRYFDRHWKNGFGVMFDDLLAAGYAIVVIVLAHLWI